MLNELLERLGPLHHCRAEDGPPPYPGYIRCYDKAGRIHALAKLMPTPYERDSKRTMMEDMHALGDLFAASPKLLAALETLADSVADLLDRNAIEAEQAQYLDRECADARAAIAKAKGGVQQ